MADGKQGARGTLKIFLGYAAGVGKTYAMLEAAHQRKNQGIGVIVGYAETHGRTETESLLKELEGIPPRQVTYRGIEQPELDVDAVLARRPQLVLVDDLAHTNAPGSRHPRRYQDVLELLDAGIDVYTTLNIQHLESLTDIVSQITGVTARETVPDAVLDQAFEVELVDLPPDELLQRVREGKVHVPEHAAQAISQFFRKGNLTALRELALRRAAARVDVQMRDYMRARAIAGPWHAAERLMVCISSGSMGERLVRNARRLADELDAEWYAVYVETPGQASLPQEQKDRLARALRLAEELGAHVFALPGRSAAETIMAEAARHNITKLIVGKPVRPRWQEMFRPSLADQLVRRSGDIDVYVVSGEAGQPVSQVASGWVPHRPWSRYLAALCVLAVATALSAVVQPFINPTNLVMIFLLAVVVAAFYLGRGPAVLVSILSVLLFDFFFVPPHLTFAVADTQYLLSFAGLFVVGLVISQLAAWVQDQASAASERSVEMTTLYGLGRDLAVAADLNDIMRAIIANVSETFGRQVAVFMPEGDQGSLKVVASSPDFGIEANALSVVQWAFEHGQAAGRGTDTQPGVRVRYLPLKTARGVLGVLGVEGASEGSYLSPEQRRLLEAFASLAAVAIERAQLADSAQKTQLLEATEKLQGALLNSISHDLRTPLVSVTGVLSSLQDDGTQLDPGTRKNLIETAREEADRLNRLVGNLLDMTRIQAGAMRVAKEPIEVQDLVGAALEQLSGRINDRVIRVDVPQDLVMPMDQGLMVQVLVNVVDNALKYSPPDSPIDISARPREDRVEIEVADRGIGIPGQDRTRVFDKFYRVERTSQVSGTGMGLAICKGIVEAHGGEIEAEPREGGGTIIRISMPLETAVSREEEKIT